MSYLAAGGHCTATDRHSGVDNAHLITTSIENDQAPQSNEEQVTHMLAGE